MERRQRQAMLADCRSQRGERLVGRSFAAFDSIEAGVEGIQRGEAFGCRRVALVGEIVGGPRKAIDRDHRRPQARRHEGRGNREIFVMTDGHANWVKPFQKGKLAGCRNERGGGSGDSGDPFPL